jgi:hypothetical protein
MNSFHRILLCFCALVFTSLACNLPMVILSHPDEVIAVTVNPLTGAGQFSVDLKGRAYQGPNTLRCYVSTPSKNVSVYTKIVTIDPSGDAASPFEETFNFKYILRGTHSLVCSINGHFESAWSDDFVVKGEGTVDENATASPTPNVTLSPIQTAIATATQTSTATATAIPPK